MINLISATSNKIDTVKDCLVYLASECVHVTRSVLHKDADEKISFHLK